MWNKNKKIIRDECEKSLPKTKKQEKVNCMSEQMVEIAMRRQETKAKKDKKSK